LRDLSFLRDSPVKELSLIGCNEARGYAVLQSLKSLDLLVLPQSYRSLPDEEFAAIAGLRQHPTLRNIESEFREATWWSINTTQSKDDFWRNWDREQAFLPALRAEGLKFALSRLSDGTYGLEIKREPVRDLSLLKGIPIRELSLIGCSITDLTPLRDMPLEYLNVPENPITDLSPLRGKGIKMLYLGGTQVADLTPLKNLPLRGLFLDHCADVEDVSVLAEIPTLEYLAVPMVRNLEALRRLPRIQRLGFEIARIPPFVPATTPEEFWRAFDANRWMHTLLDAGFHPRILRQLEDGTWEVNLDGEPISDLELLRGAPISSLNVGHTKVADLTPLRGMPLRQLHLYFAPVSDLSPLEGMRLSRLNLTATLVTDLSVLRGMPLEVIRLHVCPGITDLSPLSKSTSLRELTLPPKAKDFEFLRDFPHLERLGFQETSVWSGAHSDFIWEPDQTAGQFWRAYDEKQKTVTQAP
jgi:hypothetical protein